MTEREYDPAADSTGSYYAAIAELRRRGLIAGKFQPINDEERAIVERAREETMKKKPGLPERHWPNLWPLIQKAAAEGTPCPRNKEFARRIGCKHADTVSLAIQRAVARGDIRVEMRGNNMRRIVLPDGTATDWSERVDTSGGMRKAQEAVRVIQDAEKARKRDAMFDLLAMYARDGRPAPTNGEIALRLDWNPKTASYVLNDLIRSGRVAQEGRNDGRRFIIPGVGVVKSRPECRPKAVKPPREPKAPRQRKAKTPKVAKVWKIKTPDDMATSRAVMHDRAERIEAVAVPLTADQERAAMLARFLAKGGKPMKCPDGFGVVRNIYEVIGC